MKKNKELSIKDWRNVLKDPIFQNIESLNISGGEALLIPQCVPIIETSIKAMPKLYTIDIVSNGFATEIIKKKIVLISKLCKDKHIFFSVSISLDGIGKLHEKIRNVPFAYKKVRASIVEIIRLQKQYGFSLSVGSVVMRQTLPAVQKIKLWANKNCIKQQFQIVGFHNTYLNNLDRFSSVSFTNKDKPKLLNFLYQMGILKNLIDLEAYYWKDLYYMYKDNTPRSTPCSFVYDEFAIDALGNVYYCLSENAIGNIKKSNSVSEIYYDQTNIAKRRYIKNNVCKKCNSGCNIKKAIGYDFKKYLWFLITSTPWYGIQFHWQQLKNKFTK